MVGDAYRFRRGMTQRHLERKSVSAVVHQTLPDNGAAEQMRLRPDRRNGDAPIAPFLSHENLCDSGIVTSREEGKWTHYQISRQGSEKAIALLKEITSVTENPDSGQNGWK